MPGWRMCSLISDASEVCLFIKNALGTIERDPQ